VQVPKRAEVAEADLSRRVDRVVADSVMRLVDEREGFCWRSSGVGGGRGCWVWLFSISVDTSGCRKNVDNAELRSSCCSMNQMLLARSASRTN